VLSSGGGGGGGGGSSSSITTVGNTSYLLVYDEEQRKCDMHCRLSDLFSCWVRMYVFPTEYSTETVEEARRSAQTRPQFVDKPRWFRPTCH
jgi:hypothetical protein